VLAPDGSVLALADLPPPDAQRWVASRKAIVVAAVRGGLLSMSDACARYRLTTEEFLGWQMQVDRNGLQGLRATRVQEYRDGQRFASHASQQSAAHPSQGQRQGSIDCLARHRAPELAGNTGCAAAHHR